MPRNASGRAQIKVVEASDLKKQRRVLRHPQHDFNLKTQPFAITPFLIAAILPGETLVRGLLQDRVVTDPINNPLIGWWREYYVFFCPWRGMPDFSTAMKNMALGDASGMAALKLAANSPGYYTAKGTMPYVAECMEVVVERYFRDEGEAHSAEPVGPLGFWKAQIPQDRWIHSLKAESGGQDDTELPGVDELEELDILPGFTTYYTQWELMRDLNISDLTFEDWLRAEGITVPRSAEKTGVPQDDFPPELVRYVREWTYPTNHVDAATGTPTSACSWSISEKITKRRLFKEPGFLFGVTVTRPKVYLGNQKGNVAGALDSIYNFLPGMLQGEAYTGLKECTFSATDGILQNQTEDYWFDVADLLTFGDQFVNYAASVATGHAVGLPAANAAGVIPKRFVSDADVTALFKTAGTEYIRSDGRIGFDILGKVRQTT